jgi:non-heme chloroperoxidase
MPYVKTRDKVELFYIEGGTGKPIVFVASAWLSSKMWEFQTPYFVNQGFRCVAYDRRGHGRSDETWDGYDYDTLADDLASLLEQLDLREVTLVGHSAGCGEVARYLTRHGAGRIERIVLAGGTTPFPMKTDDNAIAIDRVLMEADLAIRTADRAKWYADNADSFFGVGLPGVSVSPEKVQFMIWQCLECSARAAFAFFLTAFTTDLRQDLHDPCARACDPRRS